MLIQVHTVIPATRVLIYHLIIQITDDGILTPLNPANITGRTPLHYAALNGHQSICELMVDTIIEKHDELDNYRKFLFTIFLLNSSFAQSNQVWQISAI